MQAIILAAGMGKRLKQLTQNNTKCMVKVCGTPLINRTLGQLDQLGLSRIVLVVGYEREKLIRHIDSLDISTPIEYVENSIYDKTNNIYSLFLAREYLLKEDTLLLESDIIFDDSVLRCLVEDPRDSLALAAKYESWMDGTCLLLSDQDDIEAMIPGSKFRFSDIDHYYKTVNLYKFSREFSRTHYVPFLEAYTAALGNNEYYEQVLKVLVSLDDPGIKAKRLAPDQLWYEIDDIQDLDIAESLFAPGADRTASGEESPAAGSCGGGHLRPAGHSPAGGAAGIPLRRGWLRHHGGAAEAAGGSQTISSWSGRPLRSGGARLRADRSHLQKIGEAVRPPRFLPAIPYC